MKKIIETVKAQTEQEMAWAIKEHGYFHSPHEGYSVMKEESAEAVSEIEIIALIGDELWQAVMSDNSEGVICNAKEIAQRAILASAELIQVGAVAMKIAESGGRGNRIARLRTRVLDGSFGRLASCGLAYGLGFVRRFHGRSP